MNDLQDKNVAIAGLLARTTRERLERMIRNRGGQLKQQIDSGTNVLIVGEHSLPISETGRVDKRLRLVQKLIGQGARIEIVPEEQFLVSLCEDDAEAGRPLFSRCQVCELLQIQPRQLHAWIRCGLIHPQQSSVGSTGFDFSQVSAAKKLLQLTRAGIKPAKLRRSLQRLQRWLGSSRSVLAQLSIIERNGTLLVRMEQGHLADPEGQMHIEFPDDHPTSYRLESAARGPDWWFDRGCEQEESGDLAEAVASYRQALLAGGPSAEVCFNLANALYSLGQKAQASERYRQAIEIDPEFIEAWNNLGIVLAEMKNCDEALWAYRKAIELDPHYADAHFNLAECLDRNGCTTDARAHWETYSRLDPVSEWSEYARSRLRARSTTPTERNRSRMRDSV